LSGEGLYPGGTYWQNENRTFGSKIIANTTACPAYLKDLKFARKWATEMSFMVD